MSENINLFEVEREEYRQFVKRIKPGCGRVEEEELELWNHGVNTKIYSKKTGKCLCCRQTFTDGKPEKYFIFEIPDADESQEYIPHPTVVLETPQQVQAVLDYIKAERQAKGLD